MERIFYISGLDCANCAAKLERHLKEIAQFKMVTIDFMGQKLLIEAVDEESLQDGLAQARKVIEKIEPGVTFTEKKKKVKQQTAATHSHGDHCGCGHDHGQEGHDHHQHGEHCGHSHGEASMCDQDAHEQKKQQIQEETVEDGHDHGYGEMKTAIVKLLLGGLIFAAGMLLPLEGLPRLLVFLTAYFIVGGEVLLRAAKNISRGQVFDENFLMTIATVGAFIVGEYPEGVAVMLFYQLGELFQSYAVNRSRNSITELMDLRADYAHLKQGDQLVKVDPEKVAVGDVIVVKAGEKIPLDGTILEGSSALDTVALTGETAPREVQPGDSVLSGCINVSGLLTVQVEKEFGESTAAKILDLVEHASSKKAQTENFITKFARYYTPAVVAVAALLAVIPPLVMNQPFDTWIYRALVFLVISCPCALVISIPLSFFSGLGANSKMGVLIKGSNYLEVLSKLDTVVFDKTGTLTQGSFQVSEIHSAHLKEAELLYYAAHTESYSNHPISKALLAAYGQPVEEDRIQDVQEISGHGVKALVDGKLVLAGNGKLMKQYEIAYEPVNTIGTIVYIAVDGQYGGCIVIADEVKPDAGKAIQALRERGVQRIIMLTGDSKAVGEKVAAQLKLDQFYAELLPGDKVEKLEMLMQQKTGEGTIAFVGDGLNDAPVLARADLGVAMGALGSDAAIEAADVVLMNDEPSRLADAMTISKKTMRIVKQNIVFTLTVKFAVLILGAIGMASMWAAVFADVGVAFIAILNAIRVLRDGSIMRKRQ